MQDSNLVVGTDAEAREERCLPALSQSQKRRRPNSLQAPKLGQVPFDMGCSDSTRSQR